MIDKSLAVRKGRRIPERLLLAFAWMGGAAAAKFAQIISGHKKLKTDYTASLNLIVMFQVSLILAIWSFQVTSDMQDKNVTALESWMGKPDTPDRPKRFGPGSKKN